jgi:putative peptidoglycan lipid II flippase
MAAGTIVPTEQNTGEISPTLVSGFTAVAEGAWMGAAQGADVLEPINLLRRRLSAARERLPTLSAASLARRELTIAEASAVLMSSFLLSALLGAVRQILFNAQFGAGASASAYYAAFRLPDTLFSLIAGGALSSAMIPVLLATRARDGEVNAYRLVNLVLTTLLAFVAVVVIAGELLAPTFVTHVLAPGFNGPTSTLTVTLTRIMLMQPLLLAVGSVATAVLNSRNQFVLTAVSIASHNIGLIGGILATRLHPGFGIYGPTWGVVAGAAIQMLILLPAIATKGHPLRPAWHLRDSRLREVITLLVPNGLAVGVLYSGSIVDTAFASAAAQSAALPAIQNAFLLVTLPIALLGQAVGQSSFPRVAAHAEAGRWDEMRATVLRSLAAVVVLSLPAVAFLLLAGRHVIHTLFEHGQFGTAAGSLTYNVLVSYAVALPAYVAAEVLSRGLIALRDTRTPLFTNTAQVVGRALIMAALIGSAGALAIPRAFAVMATLEAVALGVVLAARIRRRTRQTACPRTSG